MEESQTLISEIQDTESWIEQEQKAYENMETQKSKVKKIYFLKTFLLASFFYEQAIFLISF